MASRKQRIGIFGGSFDPPHIGHLAIAEQAREQMRLDAVYFVPAYIPPHKRKRSFARSDHRLTMTRLALRGNKFFKVSNVEIKRAGVSYTVDTVQQFRRRFPQAELFLLIGSDNLADFQKWKSYKSILTAATLLVYPRSGTASSKEASFSSRKVFFVKGEFLDISSSSIRIAASAKHSIRYLVPDAVRSYIIKKKLYRR